jgi:hypothetical protein
MEYKVGYIYDIDGNVMVELHGFEHRIEQYMMEHYGLDSVDFFLTYEPDFSENNGLNITSNCAVYYL